MNSLKKMVVAALTACAGMSQAQAMVGTFDCISTESTQVSSCSLGEATLAWSWDGSNFTIFNGADGGYVAEVYFDLGTGMDASFNLGLSSAGVMFTSGASPASLPGGNAAGFTSDEAFDSSDNTAGINGGEYAAFTVTGAVGTDGPLRFLSGLHVRSLADGNSASFVTVTTPVPEPSTYALMLAGLGVIGFVARRRRQA